MRCDECSSWICQRSRVYSDGTAQVFFEAPAGKGHCDILDLDTAPAFGCLSFSPGSTHVTVDRIEGAPWEHWIDIPCPDCNGVGSAYDRACRRCSGTAKVRRYDDGYVADATWDHPLEKERKKAQKQAPDPALLGTVLAPRAPSDGILS